VTHFLVRQHFSSMPDFRGEDYVDVRMHHFACVDGRNPNPSICTPGGDSLELALALLVHNEHMGAQHALPPCGSMEMRSFIHSVMKAVARRRNARFYLNTTAAAEAVRLGCSGGSGEVSAASALHDAVGSRAFRVVFANPQFGLLAPFATDVVRAFHAGLDEEGSWLFHHVLSENIVKDGTLAETSVLQVVNRLADDMPTVRPNCRQRGDLCFVHHVNAASHLRRLLLESIFQARCLNNSCSESEILQQCARVESMSAAIGAAMWSVANEGDEGLPVHRVSLCFSSLLCSLVFSLTHVHKYMSDSQTPMFLMKNTNTPPIAHPCSSGVSRLWW
jgi:hypothetical protein